MPRKLYFDPPPEASSPYQVDNDEPTRVKRASDELRDAMDEAAYLVPYGDPSPVTDNYADIDNDEYDDDYDDDDEYDDEEYSPEDEELDNEHRFRAAMNVFDAASIAIGVVVILALTGLLISLVSWVHSDVSSFIALFQSRI